MEPLKDIRVRELTFLGTGAGHYAVALGHDEIAFDLGLGHTWVVQGIDFRQSNSAMESQYMNANIRNRICLLLSDLIVTCKVDGMLKPLAQHNLKTTLAVDLDLA